MAEKKMTRSRTTNDGAEAIEKKMAKTSMDRINGWLEDQYERHHKASPITDSDWYDNDSNVDPDDPSEQEDYAGADSGKKRSAFQYSKEIYEMKCEWTECDYESTQVNDFVTHVSCHQPQTEQRDGDTLYCCLWDSCGFDSKDWKVVVRHINYHSFHTKIKAIGSCLVKRSKLPDCNLDYAGRNLLPVLPLELICEWEGCNYEGDNFQRFLNHVQCHVHELPMRGYGKNVKTVNCEWRDRIGFEACQIPTFKKIPQVKFNCVTHITIHEKWPKYCNKTFNVWHKLREHVRTHTQEKLVGCPVCGTQFSNTTKFYDHCKRQMSNDKKGFKCSHCRKNFATERILRDHIRLHVNLFKCPLCDMTCPFQSTLTLHIRYRHLEFKPFQCNFCEHRSKTQRDLENHQLTHCSENFWVCEQEDCDYSCRSKKVLQEHYAKNHTENIDLCLYHCHICSKKYRRGSDLTVHLKKEHSYRWASGHSRFKYIRGDDGIYRLQTVRYESIEVTKEMMKGKTNKVETQPKKEYKCKFVSPSSIIVEEKDKEEETEKRSQNAPGCSGGHLTNIDESSSDSTNFEESLKKYLGLTETSNFVSVVKNNSEKL